MKIRHIEVFNAIYTVGSVSGAARFLNITQPTASKVLKHAESQLGFQLFRRVRGRLAPTEEARILFAKTQSISEQVADLQVLARHLSVADKGRLRLASISAVGLEHMPRAIVAFQRSRPTVQVEVQTLHHENLVSALLNNDKDLGIAFNAPATPGIDHIPLGTGEFVCIYKGGEFSDAPPRLRLTDIMGHPFISIESSGPLGDLLNKTAHEAGMRLETRLKVQTYFAALNFVALGSGIAIVDEFTASCRGIHDIKCKAFDPPLKFSVQALHREAHAPSQLAKAFLKEFRKTLATARLPI